MEKLVDFFLNSHTKLPTKTIKLLSKNQEFVKAMTENKVPISMKKRIFKQKGGILPMLLPFAAKATAPLAGSLLSGSRKIILENKMIFKKSILISNDIWKQVKSNNNNFSSIKKKKKKITPSHQKTKVTIRTKAKTSNYTKHSIRCELNERAKECRKKSNLMKNAKILAKVI